MSKMLISKNLENLIKNLTFGNVLLRFELVGKPNIHANYMHIKYANYLQISCCAVKKSLGEH